MWKKIKAFFSKLFPPRVDFKSVSFHLVLKIHKNPYNSRQYIFDTIRTDGGNRYSCYVEGNNEIVFAINDATGKYFEVKLSNQKVLFIENWIYLALEFIIYETEIQIAIFINGFEKAKSIYQDAVKFDFETNRMVIGANHLKRLFGIFDQAKIIIVSPTSRKTRKKNQRLLLKNYRIEFHDQYFAKKNYVSFNGSSFMVLNKKTNAFEASNTKSAPKLKNGLINIHGSFKLYWRL